MTGVQKGDEFGQNLSRITQNQFRFLSAWIKSAYPVITNPAFKDVPAFQAEGREAGVRPLAHFALGNAVLIKTGLFDPAVTGMSENDAIQLSELAIRGVAFTHRANNPDAATHWGQGLEDKRSWQAAYWASRDAQAAWMLWDSLSDETRTAVARMVKYEADAFIDYKVPYWCNPDGGVNSPGDSKAEESAWNSRVVTIAQAMMPDDPNVSRWRQKASELIVSSYSRPSDLKNATIIEGKPVKDWLHGYNTFEDGVMVNHERAHPGYMMVHPLTYEAIIDTSLAGQFTPRSAFWNDDVTWNALTNLNFVEGENRYGARPNLPPGGTVFHKKPDGTLDPTPYFPNSDDWSRNPAADVIYVHFLMYGHYRHLDAGQSISAMDWIKAEMTALEELQHRPGHHGNVFQEGDWRGHGETDEVDAYRELTSAWILYWLDQHHQLSPLSDWGPIPQVLPAAKP